MSKATTLDHLVASYFVQGVCSNKQADILPGHDRYSFLDFQPRGKAYLRILDRESTRKGVNAAIVHLRTLKRYKWEKRRAAKHEQQFNNSAQR